MRNGDKISVLAHSQGTSVSLFGMVRQPELYKENVNSVVMFGPLAHVSKISPFYHVWIPLAVWTNPFLEMVGIFDQ